MGEEAVDQQSLPHPDRAQVGLAERQSCEQTVNLLPASWLPWHEHPPNPSIPRVLQHERRRCRPFINVGLCGVRAPAL